jgi:hypothetical protein
MKKKMNWKKKKSEKKLLQTRKKKTRARMGNESKNGRDDKKIHVE